MPFVVFQVGGAVSYTHLDVYKRQVDALASQGIRYVTYTLAADVSMTDSVYWGSGGCWDDTPYSFQP